MKNGQHWARQELGSAQLGEQPAASALDYASRDEIDGAIVLAESRKWKLGQDVTVEQFVLLAANIGGYTGRSSGGPPGSIVIARGLANPKPAERRLAPPNKPRTSRSKPGLGL